MVFFLPKIHHLLEHGLARDVKDSPGDNVADLTADVGADDIESPPKRHGINFVKGNLSVLRRSQ